MSSFNARLRLPGSRLPLGVEVDIIHERMTVTAGERRVAEWPLERLDVKMRPDGFHIQVDGEELVLAVSDSRGFATALGVSDSTNGTSVPSMRLAAKAESNERDLAELRRRISDLGRRHIARRSLRRGPARGGQERSRCGLHALQAAHARPQAGRLRRRQS